MVEIDQSRWSGEGAFTQVLVDLLRDIPEIAGLRVEDAPASQSGADYNFISNEIFVSFGTTVRSEPTRRFGLFPGSRAVTEKAMTLAALESALASAAEVGSPDYSDEGMLQYLRTERIIPPYQTRGYKQVELVRVYEAGTPSRA
jgi:hypothetical protein